MTSPERAAMLLDLVQRQRAHRAFANDEVDDDLVERVLRVATFAPSSENHQPWVFVVVRDPGRRAAIGELMREVWLRGGREYTKGSSDERVFRDVDAGINGGVANAPVMVVVGGDTTKVHRQWLKSSIFPAIQNLLLAAAAEGLGSALTTIASMHGNALAELVAFPDHIEALAVVPLGWPARPLGPARRVPFQEKSYRERFGNAWSTPRS